MATFDIQMHGDSKKKDDDVFGIHLSEGYFEFITIRQITNS